MYYYENPIKENYMRELLTNEQRRRNGISLKLTDREHKAISDAAWKNRRTASALIREATYSFLKTTEGINLEETDVQ